MYEERNTKTIKSKKVSLFRFPAVVNAYLILTILFIVSLIITSFLADKHGGGFMSNLADKMVDFMLVVLGATFGAFSAGFGDRK